MTGVGKRFAPLVFGLLISQNVLKQSVISPTALGMVTRT